jgi:uncharacterized protein
MRSPTYIQAQTKYQLRLLACAVLVLGGLFYFRPTEVSGFFQIGNIAAPAAGVAWLGINEGESWLSLGVTLSVVITCMTSLFVYLQFRKTGGSFKQIQSHFGWIILFSVTNSFSEEIIFRLGIITTLLNHVDVHYILLISAIAFGLPHLKGMPNGIIGAGMAGLLGWILAKSMIETNGFFWAWVIHFLQDVVIFSALIMAKTASELRPVLVSQVR